MSTKAKWLLPTVAIALTMVAGCGNSSQPVSSNNANSPNSSASNSSSSGKTITLRFAWWGNQSREKLTQQAIELFEKEHPSIKIQPEFSSFASYWQKMNAEAAGNNLPDVMQQNYINCPEYSTKGLLLDLTPYAKDGVIDTKYISKQLLDTGVYNGKLMGVVNGENALAILYNPDLLKKAGLGDPPNNWTWTDFENMAETIHQKDGVYGAVTLSPDLGPEYYIRQHGAHLYNKALNALGYSNNNLLADYWGINLKLIGEGAAPTEGEMQQVQGQEQDPIALGKAALELNWTNEVDPESSGGKVPLKLAPPPGPGQSKGLYLHPSMFFSIAKNSKYPKESAEFINFLENNIDAGMILGIDRGIPVNSQVRDKLKPTLPPLDQEQFTYLDYVTKHSSPFDLDNVAKAAQLRTALEDVDQAVLYKKESPLQGAKDFRKQATALLK